MENVSGRWKARWHRFRDLPPGTRFAGFHHEQRDQPIAVKLAFVALALAAFATGAFLAFVPGPAVLFFAVGAALLAAQSLWVARALDRGEVWGRRQLASLRGWWRRRRAQG